jgi:TatA/E family protein of Tat protein translocase
MGLDNPLHLAFLVMLLLLVFGAKRLPEMGRSLGAGMRGFRESIGGETSHVPPTGGVSESKGERGRADEHAEARATVGHS